MEQAGLGGLVALHGAVVVEVIAGQIGERGQCNAHAVHAALLDADGGGLHGHCLGAGVAHGGQQAMHRQHIGRGQAATQCLTVGQHRPQRADGAAGLSLRLSACAIHWTEEVLPLVPVTATTASSADGRSYQVSPSPPSRPRKPVTCSNGTWPACASMASSTGASHSTARAPCATPFLYRNVRRWTGRRRRRTHRPARSRASPA